MNPDWERKVFLSLFLLVVLAGGVGCSLENQFNRSEGTHNITPIPYFSSPPPVIASITSTPGLSDDQIKTLVSLRKVDDYPLYTMVYGGSYELLDELAVDQDTRLWHASQVRWGMPADWACSLFAAIADRKTLYFGRNFDWEYSPALFLFTDPPEGYASVSMVDIAYLGFDPGDFNSLTDLPVDQRQPLLSAPMWPFDGMNETGVAIGMAAVPSAEQVYDPSREDIGSLEIMREILDHAANVAEAISIFKHFNIIFEGGPALHYLVADSSGDSILVEFIHGELQLIVSENPWHLATNFLVNSADKTEGLCTRYDAISEQLTKDQGRINRAQAMDLLSEVSQQNTQWSILYDMGEGKIQIVMDRNYDQPHPFQLIP